MRKNGVLLHISSLPSRYGIGSLGKSCYEFADFLREAKVDIWQVLPIGHTSYGDSPYQSFSTFAGNPYFIDLDTLVEEGVLDKKDLPKEYENCDYVDYGELYKERYQTLRKAYNRSYGKLKENIEKFSNEQEWLEDYCLFMALKGKFGGKSWQEWSDIDLKKREKKAIDKAKKELRGEIEFYKFMQYLFFKEWNELKKYVNNLGIEICGDTPIYVALDSADVWSAPQNFQLDENLYPKQVAGVPPDYFSLDGQLWGNPLFDWEYLEKTNFSWWLKKLSFAGKLYDIIRIDHFIGFARYYSIPANSKTAKIGEWKLGKGDKLFDCVTRSFPDIKIIAEDLGVVTKEVTDLRDKYNFPGMAVLQFSLDSKEDDDKLPRNYRENLFAYTGTHDNPPILGWWKEQSEETQEFILKYLKVDGDGDIAENLIVELLNSPANTAVVPMQDYLKLGSLARMNEPGTVGGNWKWRLNDKYINKELANYIYSLNKRTNRIKKS